MARAAIPTTTASMIAISTIAWPAWEPGAISVLGPEDRRGGDLDSIRGGLGDHRGDQDEVELQRHLELLVAAGRVHCAARAGGHCRVFPTWRVRRRRCLHRGGWARLRDVQVGGIFRRDGACHGAMGARGAR